MDQHFTTLRRALYLIHSALRDFESRTELVIHAGETPPEGKSQRDLNSRGDQVAIGIEGLAAEGVAAADAILEAGADPWVSSARGALGVALGAAQNRKHEGFLAIRPTLRGAILADPDNT